MKIRKLRLQKVLKHWALLSEDVEGVLELINLEQML
jgi:hypothetical protein